MSLEKKQVLFESIGGKFVSPIAVMAQKLKNINTFLFDWDGVFNTGEKLNGASTFSETDSMGINMLRFGYWLANKKNMPFLGIITGLNNPCATELANREHFNGIFYSIKHKVQAVEFLENEYQINAKSCCFMFDDILDLSAAKVCGLRILVNRTCNPLLKQYAIENNLCDYITGHTGGQGAIREVTELLLALFDNFDTVVKERIKYIPTYKTFVEQRKTVNTLTFTQQDKIVKINT